MGLVMELQRSTTLGVRGVCFHPGSYVGGTLEQSITNVVRAMTMALEKNQGETRLFIENTAGAGNTVGRTAREVAAMLEGLPAALRSRAGYGLDTCHLFASGYDIHTSEARFRAILDEFQREIGEAPSFFHVNDSEKEFGSNRDRHALIGEGQIGAEPFRWLLRDPRSRGVPLILETPQTTEAIGENDLSPDANDMRMLELLRSLS
jgi:deoxyribonuclease-4